MEFVSWSRAALHNVASGGFYTPAVAISGIVPQSRPKALFFGILRSLLLTDRFSIRRYIARANESFLRP
jgi:hypothetical protein